MIFRVLLRVQNLQEIASCFGGAGLGDFYIASNICLILLFFNIDTSRLCNQPWIGSRMTYSVRGNMYSIVTSSIMRQLVYVSVLILRMKPRVTLSSLNSPSKL